MPPRLPMAADKLAGRVVRLASGDCLYRDAPLALRITRVRVDISHWYGGDWVWLEGDALDHRCRPTERIQVLAAVAALPTV